MNADLVIEAMALPPQARVEQRVAKKLLIENGAPTAGDKRAIAGGVEEMVWAACLKPTTIGVPAYEDEVRQYLEIAVLALQLRPGAKAARLRELVHRAIPYPVVLVTVHEEEVSFSLAHLRHAQNEAGRFVIDGEVETVSVAAGRVGQAFLDSLALAGLPNRDLWHLYQGWLDRLWALEAADRTGTFSLCPDREAAAARRQALRELDRLDGEIAELAGKAKKEPQLNRRVELNLAIRQLNGARSECLARLGRCRP